MMVSSSWRDAALGEVCQIVSGGTPKSAVPEYWGGSINWITPHDLSQDRSQTLSHGARSLTQAGYDSCSARLVPKGSVIVSSRAPVGYVTIAGAQVATNQGCKTAVPPDYIDPRFLYWFLIAAKPDLESRASGTTFKEISGKRFGETRLRWPDLAAQRHIVDVLEARLSHLDAAQRSLSLARARSLALRVSSLAIAADGEPITLGDLAIKTDYGTSEKCVVGGPGPAVIRIPNLLDGCVDLRDEKRVMSPAADVSRSMVQPGDVLIVRTNGSVDLIGRAGVVQPGINAAFASYLIRYRVDTNRVHPHWVQAMLSAPQTRALLQRLAASSAGQHNLSVGKLNGVLIPVPSMNAQIARLAHLSAQTEDLSRLTSALTKAEARATALRRAVLQAAFSGRPTGLASDLSAAEEMLDA